MKIAIIGTGGVGGYFGGRLALHGHDVTFLARGDHRAAIDRQGLQVKSVLGDFEVNPAKTVDDISEMGKSDLILIAVKAWQLKEIVTKLEPLVDNSTLVIPLLNGVDALQELQTGITQKNLLGGLCRIISQIESPGVINHFAVEPSITLGELENKPTPRLEELQKEFEAAGIKTHVSEHIQDELWKKFIMICTGGLLAVTRSNYGEVLGNDTTRKMLTGLMQEIHQLSLALGLNIDYSYVEETLKFLDKMDPKSTASMSRDIWDGKPSELDYLNGAVVRLADQYGVEVPINQFIYTSLILMEERARE